MTKHKVQWPFFEADYLFVAVICLLFFYVSLIPFYYLQPQDLSNAIPLFSIANAAKYLPLIFSAGAFFLAVYSIRNTIFRVTSCIEWLIYGFLAVSLASLIGAAYPWVGLAKWIYYNATGCLLCLAIWKSLRRWNLVNYLAKFMSITSGVVALYTVHTGLGGEGLWTNIQMQFNPYFARSRALGPFGHTVATASYIMFFFPLALWMWSTIKSRLYKLVWGVVCCAYIPAILLTQTRAAQLAVCACLIVLFPWWKQAIKSIKIVRKLAAVLIVVMSWGIYLFSGNEGGISRFVGSIEQVQERWWQVLNPRPITINSGGREFTYGSRFEYTERFRIAQYHTVANILREHPLLGVGFGTFTRSFAEYKYTGSYLEWEFSEHTTENMYLMFLAETGIFGLIVWLLIWASIGVYIYRRYRHSKGEIQSFLLAYLAGVIGLSLNMVTWDILNEATLRIAYWVFTGIALAASSLAADAKFDSE